MKYCYNTTVSHPLSQKCPNHVVLINQVIIEEGGIDQPFTKEVCLKLDLVKSDSNDKDIVRLKSMDLVLGLKDDKSLSTILVDFKFRCKNPINIREGDCRDKIKHSKLLLFGSGIAVYPKFVFIFNDELIQQSKRVLSQKLINTASDVMSLSDFKDQYF